MGLLDRASNFREEDEHPLAPTGLRARAEMLRREGEPDASQSAPVETAAPAPAAGVPAAAGVAAAPAAPPPAAPPPSSPPRTPAEESPRPRGLLARASALRDLSSAAFGLRARAEMFRREGDASSDAPPPADSMPVTEAPMEAPPPADTGTERPRGLLARATEFREHVPPPISEEDRESLKAEVGSGLLARAEAMRAEGPGAEEPVVEEPAVEEPVADMAAEPVAAPDIAEPVSAPMDLSPPAEEYEIDQGDLVLDEFRDEVPAGGDDVAADAPGDLLDSDETTILHDAPTASETVSAGEPGEPPRVVPSTEPAPPPASTRSDASPTEGGIQLVAQEGREIHTEPPLEPDLDIEADVDAVLEQEGGPPTADELELGLLMDDLPEPEHDDLELLDEDYTIKEGDDELPEAVRQVVQDRAEKGAADQGEDAGSEAGEGDSEGDLRYEGNSSPEDDPALDHVRAEEETEEDLEEPEDETGFAGWERDAEREAERRVLSGAPEEEPVEKPETHLFSDDDMSTRPVETHIASQKKIDNYLSLFDISKEISHIDDSETLWDAVLYAVMGQLGAESICIFSSANKQRNGSIFYPTAHSGFDLPLSGWVLKPGDHIYETMKKERGVRYAAEFLDGSQISELERDMLQGAGANLIVPLKNMDRMFGIMFLGRQLSGDDYGIDDMEFLALLGEVAAVGVDRVIARLEYEQDTEELRRQNAMHGRIFSVARNISGIKDIDELYDILTEHLTKDFGVESYSVALLHPGKQEYRIFGGNQISPASIDKFKLDVSSELIGLISNLTRVYELPNFRANPEITSIYTNDDLALMQHYWIVPLISLNWLVGFMTIHRTSIQWTEYQRELVVSAAEMMAPVFANAIILGERETIFRDPFSPLEGRLRLEMKRAAEFNSPVSMVEIRVKNLKRLIALNPQEQIAEFLADLGRSVAGFLFETDFLARVSQGRFALILPGRNKKEAEVFTKKLKAEFKRKRLLPGSPVDIQYSYNIIVSPEDTDDPGKMLALLD